MRTPIPRKRGSQVGSVVDPFRRRQVRYESRLEREWALVLIARPDVREIREQQTASWITSEGRRKYTCDFHVAWASGRRTAFEVKYEEDAERTDVRERIAAAAANVGDEFADDYRLLTERHLPREAIERAEYLISCALDFDEEAVATVRSYLGTAGTTVTIEAIADATRLGHRATRAAALLAREGALVPENGDSLAPGARFANALVSPR